MAVQFHEPSLPHSSDEDSVPVEGFALGAQDNRNSLMDADNEVANITVGIQSEVKFDSNQRQSGVKFTEPPEVKFSEPPGVKFSEPPGVKFSEPPGVKFSEPPGVKFSEPLGVKFSEPVGVKFSEPPVEQFSEPPGVKFSEPPGVKFSEPVGVKFSEPPGEQFSEPPGVKFSDPDRQDFEGGRKGAKSQELHVTISTPDSVKPQATGSIRRKHNINFDVPPVS